VTRPVPSELAGERVDKIVAVLAGISRAAASAMVEASGVEVDGRSAAGNERLKEGTIISFSEPTTEPLLVPDPNVPFSVVFEDRWMIVIDKPSGIVVHPGAGKETGTLASGVLARWPEIEGVGEDGRWGIVHRLDRETSGLLLVAKTPEAHSELQTAIGDRLVSRQYYTLVHGRLAMTTGTIDAPVGRDPVRATRMSVHPDGRPARTHYSVVAGWDDRASLLDVSLETGRTHQIRVHLASIDHPVFDDRSYGRGGPKSGAGRLWLHAHRLELVHPVTDEPMTFDAEIPMDLAGTLETLGEPDFGSVDA